MSSVVGIEQGTCVLFSDFADGGVMWTGQGERETRQVVRFNEAFLKQPSVMVSMSMWDVDNKHNSRVDLVAENITETGFELLFRTWGDTRIARIRADWMAIGAVHDPETWQLY
jgi:hypothetical protein